jgi:hypothetical protein
MEAMATKKKLFRIQEEIANSIKIVGSHAPPAHNRSLADMGALAQIADDRHE